MSDIPKIYEAISAVMRDVGAVGKTEKNDTQRYKYRGIDAMYNALSPAMVKNHVCVLPKVLESTREERTTKNGSLLIYTILKMEYTFFTDDGSSVTAVVIGEAMDSSDKSTNKAMSAAFKYACFQTFCIPTEEMKDSEADSPEAMPKQETMPKQKTGGTIPGYPTREDMLKVIKDVIPAKSDGEKRLFEMNNLNRWEDATDQQVASTYDYVIKVLKK